MGETGRGGAGKRDAESIGFCGVVNRYPFRRESASPHTCLAAKGQECLGMCLEPRSGFVQAGCVFVHENHDKEQEK